MASLSKIFHFNPTCEIAIANGSPFYQAPALLRNFEEELAPILLFFTSSNDFVLSSRTPSSRVVDTYKEFKLSQGELITKEKALKQTANLPVQLSPWGWSSAELNYLSEFQQTNEQLQQVQRLLQSDLFQRKHAVQFLSDFLSNHTDPIFPRTKDLPRIMHTVDEVANFLEQKQQIVLKSPLSSSGRGLQVIRKNQLNTSNLRWINTIIKQQHYLIAEPLFDKQVDLSFQFEITADHSIRYHGISYFDTNSNGQYQGHWLYPSQAKVNPFFNENELNQLASELIKQLENSPFSSIYRGFIGIDALIYQEGQQAKIHPCLEINPRMNMGILSKYMEQKIHPESSGQYRVYYNPKVPFIDFIKQAQQKNPPFAVDQKLCKGLVPLTAPEPQSKFGAYLNLR